MQVFAPALQEPASKGTLKQLLRAAEAAAHQYRAHAALGFAFMSCAKLAASDVELCAPTSLSSDPLACALDITLHAMVKQHPTLWDAVVLWHALC